MYKPITVERKEFIDNICSLINESSLPIFVVRNLLFELDKQLANAEEKQYEEDKKAWEEYLAEQAESNTSDEEQSVNKEN